MANQITDNRTLIDSANVVGTVWVDLADSGTPTLDTEIKIQGTGSMGKYCTTSRDGIFYKYASAQNLANNHIYIWANCGIVGLLDTKANQGFTFRARGDTATNYLEWDLGGSDDWPTTVSGGWAMFVIDLESTPSRTGGTPPATTAIRSLGCTFITASVMPRMADNTWIDEIRRLPDGSNGIIVEGRNGGSIDWTWSDIPAQLGSANGTATEGPAGTIVLNTPVQFFIDDASTHAFSSTNEVVLWGDQQYAANDLYKITVLGAATGTANWKMGSKTGSGAAATGTQGGSILAQNTGVRWSLDADIANIDSFNLYGVTLVHGGDFQLDTAINEVISSLFIDTTTVEATNSNAFFKNSYINSNTAVDTGSLVWNENVDVDGILDGSSFQKGANAHHAIDFGASVTSNLTLRNCSFNGFGSTADSNDSTVRFLAGSGSLTLSLVGCTVDGVAATTSNFSVDDAAGITVTVSIDPVTTLINIKDPDGNNEENVRVYLEATYVDSGFHTGANNASVLTDSGKSWTTDKFVGQKVVNTTDGSAGTITANTSTTITATLAGGTDNDWDTNDNYIINAVLPVDEPVSISRVGGTATVTHTAHGMNSNEYIKLSGIINIEEDNSGAFQITVTSPNEYTYTTGSGTDTYTGAIRATGAIIYGVTDANGNIFSSRTYGLNQPITGYARKLNDGVNYFKTIELIDTVNSSTGLTVNRRLVSDGLVNP